MLINYCPEIDGNEHRRGIYSIGAVARMLAVDAATIRNWEQRYELVRPQRSDGGHRLFSVEDVDRLRFVADAVAAGHSPREAHRLLRVHLQDGRPLRVDAPAAAGARVLVVERDRHAANLAEHFLREAGYDVECTFDIEEARARCRERAPQVAIVDLLSGRDAFELCGVLKAGGAAVLAVSALSTLQPALASRSDAFLRKPVHPPRLVATVGELLAAGAARRTATAGD